MVRHGRARGRGRASLAALGCALALLTWSVLLPSTQAAFSAVTANPGNELSADQLAPPSGLSAAQTCAAPPPIAHRGAATATGTDTLALPVPAGTVAGDVLVAQVAHGFTSAGLGVPSGWTLVRQDHSGSTVTSALFTRTATADEPSATFSFPAGSGIEMLGGVAAYSGVSASAPVDASSGVTGFGRVASMPAVTTTTSDTMLLRLVTNDYESYPAPTGTTQRWRFGTTGKGGLMAADEPFVGPGAASARSSSSPTGTSAYGIGQTLALRRAAGTPSAALSWTASPSAWATGYRLERSRGGTVEAGSTVAPIGSTSTSDGPLLNGVTYSYLLWSRHGGWTSPAATATFTPSC